MGSTLKSVYPTNEFVDQTIHVSDQLIVILRCYPTTIEVISISPFERNADKSVHSQYFYITEC